LYIVSLVKAFADVSRLQVNSEQRRRRMPTTNDVVDQHRKCFSGASFSMREQSVDGEYAHILWTAETADNSYEADTDTFVLRNGKIVAQSFAAKDLLKVLAAGKN
jgi:hypothetical protein